MVVYRNVRFVGWKNLPGVGMMEFSQFLELEQANGHAVFIARLGILRICEHGTELLIEKPPV